MTGDIAPGGRFPARKLDAIDGVLDGRCVWDETEKAWYRASSGGMRSECRLPRYGLETRLDDTSDIWRCTGATVA